MIDFYLFHATSHGITGTNWPYAYERNAGRYLDGEEEREGTYR